MKEFILLHTISLCFGILLDQIIGDPHFLPHPVRDIGRFIQCLENRLLGRPGAEKERDGRKERINGALLWFIVIFTVGAVMFILTAAAYMAGPVFGVIAESILSCYILAARSLYRESMPVYRKLKDGDTEGARYAVSMIVGRDTKDLDKEEITKAAVETVAENTSDGVIAPLICLAVGGPVLGMMYKAVNTMDSMIGYKNERYGNFGAFAAHADDVFNFLPSRISALLMIAGTFLFGVFSPAYSGKRAFRIWIRDRRKHSSPNSAQTESVCAGALGIRLGGTHLYKGVPVEKPTIGDALREVEIVDIRRANLLMFITEAFASVLLLAILYAVMMLI